MILARRNKKNSKGSPQASHSFKQKWKPVTVSNSCLRDKNPPSTVCWRGQWLKEQAALMSTDLLLMGEQERERERARRKKKYSNESENKLTKAQFRVSFRNTVRARERQGQS